MSKIVVVGIDAVVPEFLERFVAEGSLPNVAKLMERGAYMRNIPVLPPLTATNWTTIATGAEPHVHEVSDFFVHHHGNHPYELESGFSSEANRAETLWQVADQEGKKTVLLNFPSSYPVEIENVTHVLDYGSPSRAPHEVTFASCFTTKPNIKDSERIELATASGWESVTGDTVDSEFEISILPSEWEIGWPFTKRELTPDSTGVTYQIGVAEDRSQIWITKDKSETVTNLKPGEWSDFIVEDFVVRGTDVRASFQFKLIELNGNDIRLYVTQVYPTHDFTEPVDLSKTLYDKLGPARPLGYNNLPVKAGWIDFETFKEETDYSAEWLSGALEILLAEPDWELFFMKWHSPDHVEHAYWHMIDPVSPHHKPEDVEEGWAIFRWDYQAFDKILGTVLDNVDDDTTVILVGDHGHIADVQSIMMNDALAEAGLLTYNDDGTIDWSKTKAYSQRLMYIYINLEGREPTGIVKQQDYPAVQNQIINMLLGLCDPRTGDHPVQLAVTVEDALALGVGGPTVGDVVYLLKPGYGAVDSRTRFSKVFPLPEDDPPTVWGHSHHGQNFGNAKLSEGSINSIFIVAGPQVKAGIKRDKPIRMTDIAPTIAHLAGLRAPQQNAGSVLRDILR